MLVLVLVFEDSLLSSILCAPALISNNSITYPLSPQSHQHLPTVICYLGGGK